MRALLTLLAAALGCLALTACGGGSSSTAATSSAKAGANPAPTSARGPGSSRFAALRTCLAKQGVTLPARPSGKRSSGPQLPKGVTRASYQAALKKCGGASLSRGGAGGAPPSGSAPTGGGGPPAGGEGAPTGGAPPEGA